MQVVPVAGNAIKWLRDSMKMIKTADEINTLAGSVSSTSGVYFVTAFSGLLAPYWDPGATGLLVSLTSYTTPARIANAFQTRAVIERVGARASLGGILRGQSRLRGLIRRAARILRRDWVSVLFQSVCAIECYDRI